MRPTVGTLGDVEWSSAGRRAWRVSRCPLERSQTLALERPHDVERHSLATGATSPTSDDNDEGGSRGEPLSNDLGNRDATSPGLTLQALGDGLGNYDTE